MHLYVELWKARPAWLALSTEERSAYMAQVGPAISTLLESGIEIFGFAMSDDDTPHDAGYTYVAAWKMPSLDHAKMLEDAVAGAGWHDYFEQVNARGPLVEPGVAIEHMVNLS